MKIVVCKLILGAAVLGASCVGACASRSEVSESSSKVDPVEVVVDQEGALVDADGPCYLHLRENKEAYRRALGITFIQNLEICVGDTVVFMDPQGSDAKMHRGQVTSLLPPPDRGESMQIFVEITDIHKLTRAEVKQQEYFCPTKPADGFFEPFQGEQKSAQIGGKFFVAKPKEVDCD